MSDLPPTVPPARVDAPVPRVTVDRLLAEIVAVPDGSWTEAIRRVLAAHAGKVIAP